MTRIKGLRGLVCMHLPPTMVSNLADALSVLRILRNCRLTERGIAPRLLLFANKSPRVAMSFLRARRTARIVLTAILRNNVCYGERISFVLVAIVPNGSGIFNSFAGIVRSEVYTRRQKCTHWSKSVFVSNKNHFWISEHVGPRMCFSSKNN